MKYLLSDYDFKLPSHLIALHPKQRRDECKLLYFNKKNQTQKELLFKEISNLLKEGDTLVINDTKVDASRLYVKLEGKESTFEVLLLNKTINSLWECKIKGRKKLKEGQKLWINETDSLTLIKKYADDNNLVELNIVSDNTLASLAQLPLPSYIIGKRAYQKSDEQNYQTVYAKHAGSKAAPTAGLHFTHDLLDALKKSGVNIVSIQLFVSLGTFQPIMVENIKDHKMHQETYFIDKKASDALNNALKEKRKIIAVGTTALRTLESSFDEKNSRFIEGENKTSLFIMPNYNVKVANALITNFHTPKSTLLVLIASLIGYRNMKKNYELAIKKEYQFFSYGDAFFIDNIK
jgi:S-adenosylmethionine:tRNA ribosyltransferase-isomerase